MIHTWTPIYLLQLCMQTPRSQNIMRATTVLRADQERFLALLHTRQRVISCTGTGAVAIFCEFTSHP